MPQPATAMRRLSLTERTVFAALRRLDCAPRLNAMASLSTPAQVVAAVSGSAARPSGAARMLADTLLAAERGRLSLWLPVAMGCGLLAYFSLRTEPGLAWCWLPVAPLLAALILARRAPLAAWCAGLATAAALGFAGVIWLAARLPPPLVLPARAVIAQGTVEQVELLPEGRRVTLSRPRLTPDGPALARTIRIRLRSGDPARPAPGDRLEVRALLRGPAAPAYPGAWDFQRAAFFAGQGGAGFAIGPAQVSPGEGNATLAALRAMLEQRVAAAIPGSAGAIAAALITGSQGVIPAADLAAMRDAGLAHLLSVSGLHIAIVMGVSFATLRFLIACCRPLALRVPGKAVAALGALAAGGFYLLLTGTQVPMLRSFAMAALVTLGVIAGRRAISLRGLALAAAVVMLVQPAALLGPSFQMSFAAVLALIAAWEAARGWFTRLRGDGAWWRRILVALAGVAATSLIAGAATTPFGLAHFGRLQWYGMAANAIAVPLTSILVMPAGMLGVLLMPLGLDAPALWAMGQGVEAILWVARNVAAWPGATQAATPLPAWGLGLFAFGLLWLCLWRARWRLAGIPLIAAGLLSGLTVRPPDLLISGDARLIAAHLEGNLYLQRLNGASNLTRDTWLRLYAITSRPFPTEHATPGLACTAGACRIQPRPDSTSAILLRGGAPATACGQADLLVAAEPTRTRCDASITIDRFTVWRDGPHAIWLTPGRPNIVADRSWRGARPWTPPLPRPRSAIAPDEPPAPVE